MEEPLKIVRLGDCSPGERQQLLKRAEIDATLVVPTVRVIVEEVKRRGDEALFEYSSSLDKVKLSSKQLQVSKEEISEAYRKIDSEVVDAIKKAAKASSRTTMRVMKRQQVRSDISKLQKDGFRRSLRCIRRLLVIRLKTCSQSKEQLL